MDAKKEYKISVGERNTTQNTLRTKQINKHGAQNWMPDMPSKDKKKKTIVTSLHRRLILKNKKKTFNGSFRMEKSPGATELLMRLVWQEAHFKNIVCVHDLVMRQRPSHEQFTY